MIASLLLALTIPAASTPAWRVFAEPRDAAESALQQAAQREGGAGLEALAAVSRLYPDSAVSGLALLAAGLRHEDAGRHAEAIARLTQPDVARTGLGDHALFGIGRAQEGLGQTQAATRAYLAAAAEPDSAFVCAALPRAAALLLKAGQADAAVTALEQVVAACQQQVPAALLSLGEARLAHGDRAAAAQAFDALDREHATTSEATQARARLTALADALPARTAEERARALFARGSALLEAGRNREALEALRAVALAALPPADADQARVALARALFARGRSREAVALLQKFPAGSTETAQAAFYLAKDRARATRTPEAFEAVADAHRGTPWAEEALFALANHYQKDALDEKALPWWRRLLGEYPQGRYVERAAWRVGWADYRAGRHEAAAQTLESAARLRPPGGATAGFLYWAGRARQALGQTERARQLLQETVQRYKFAYHGLRAREALAHLGAAPDAHAEVVADTAGDEGEAHVSRARQLLLADLLDDAAAELRRLPQSPRVQATLAWIEWRHGQYRSALVAMKRAYPEWISEAGDRLPPEVWHILFPLRYQDQLRAAAAQESLDPALVAAVILQESTFDASALSRAGARGLMQVMPATGRRIARDKGQRFRRAALHDPGTSLDFGTHYLRQMSARFSGSVEKVLAAYNAGPHRVDAWTAERGELPGEEFIESIPFSETRSYVMIILASREHYRRLYGLGARSAPGPVTGSARP